MIIVNVILNIFLKKVITIVITLKSISLPKMNIILKSGGKFIFASAFAFLFYIILFLQLLRFRCKHSKARKRQKDEIDLVGHRGLLSEAVT